MRQLNLIPEDVLARRRRDRLLRRNAVGLALWCAVLGCGLDAAQRWHGAERQHVRDLEASLRATQARSALLVPLREHRALLLERVSFVRRLEAHRPVTGVVALVAATLPPRMQLESLDIREPVAPAAQPVPLQIELRGNGGDADDVAQLLRRLEASGRFRRVQLTRLDRNAQDDGKLRFEMRCEL